MKILYVEDEIVKNIERTDTLFGALLTKKKRKSLQGLELERRKTADQVKRLLESSSVIHVATSFSEALQQINSREFDLYIVDRNLNPDEEEMDRVKEIDPAFKKDEHLEMRYETRQGDYIFSRLLHSGQYNKDNFFFLSAYSFDDFKERYGNDPQIADALALGTISEDNHIDKGNKQSLGIIKDRIKNLNEYAVRQKYADYFGVFTQVGINNTDTYLKLLKDAEKERTGSLNDIRMIYEEILSHKWPESFAKNTYNWEKVDSIFGVGPDCSDQVSKTAAITLYKLTSSGSHSGNYTEEEELQAFMAAFYLLQLFIIRIEIGESFSFPA